MLDVNWPVGYKRQRGPLISVLDKMIVADLARTVVAVLSVVVVIIVSRKFIKILEKAIEGAISNETLLNILGLKMISAAITFLPAALFMAILMVVGRMYRDQEMSAIFSAGGGAWTVYRSVLYLVLPLALMAAGLSFYMGPWAEATTNQLMSKDEKTADIRGISAGRFSEYQHGDLVFYVEHISKDKKMHQVFVQHRQKDNIAIVSADAGRMENLPGGLYMILEHGQRVQGVLSKKNYIIEEFDEYGIRLEEKDSTVRFEREAVPTHALWESKTIKDIAELQRRFSVPAGVLFLSLLAVPLAQTSPRAGIYGNLLTAFLIYFSYGNLVRVNHSWVVKEQIPVWLGSFWLYLVLLLVAGIFLIKFYGWRFVGLRLRDKVAR
ncbi:MAG: LPS export ABC transporter permease LptF [Gammaproteobacteria bacterium]